MSAHLSLLSRSAILLLLAHNVGTPAPARPQNAKASPSQITILYDAFGKDPALQKDWGYAALVEYGGKRILFDTGNNPDVLTHNAKPKTSISPSLTSS